MFLPVVKTLKIMERRVRKHRRKALVFAEEVKLNAVLYAIEEAIRFYEHEMRSHKDVDDR